MNLDLQNHDNKTKQFLMNFFLAYRPIAVKKPFAGVLCFLLVLIDMMSYTVYT